MTLVQSFFRFRSLSVLSSVVRRARMDVHIVPILEDNFSYILVDRATNEAAVIDPAEAPKVVEAVRAANVTLKAVLTTHHHWDHAGGNKEFVQSFPVPVYGGDERVDALTTLVHDGNEFKIGELNVRVFHNPCHTTDSVSYYVTKGDEKAIFTGDTLFVAGCGRFFEGTAEQMTNNMLNIYARLPSETLVYPGHEYTVANLKFAQSAEPENAAIKSKLAWALNQRTLGKHTVPSTLAEEHQINPFMRVTLQSIQEFTHTTDPVLAMAALRELKNNFKANI